ncbi:putative exported domain protein [Yersinia pestis PY-13]|nr:putative exported domain protein [Yersinia pestis PY-02]EIR09232.1 putative exported domain protein [Yersinia pestis PY-05]EIR11304.1 putative exported domain protein [Yersinia pestis PY-06]EIR38570.1 putative exported domain protein [Yersinia pestis PY-10]EIR39272.1 putative exported domain protein [Yersinia pestis PY-12]EIR51932.1 putative exported domain protein [Yersinia pestis PY-13]EIR66069.1 putative exported domain protein [Yersinia pestis PY-16]EIR95436.1 hypothetical protein YPP
MLLASKAIIIHKMERPSPTLMLLVILTSKIQASRSEMLPMVAPA